MAGANMLERSINLESQPGGVMPELHLKKGTTSMRIRLMIPRDGITDYSSKACVVSGKRPDGQEIFERSGCGLENRKIAVWLYANVVEKMAAVAGRYKMTATIANSRSYIRQADFMNYDLHSVLPFMVVVE